MEGGIRGKEKAGGNEKTAGSEKAHGSENAMESETRKESKTAATTHFATQKQTKSGERKHLQKSKTCVLFRRHENSAA